MSASGRNWRERGFPLRTSLTRKVEKTPMIAFSYPPSSSPLSSAQVPLSPDHICFVSLSFSLPLVLSILTKLSYLLYPIQIHKNLKHAGFVQDRQGLKVLLVRLSEWCPGQNLRHLAGETLRVGKSCVCVTWHL